MAPMRHYVRRSIPAQPAEVPEQAGSSEMQELRAQMTALVGVVQRQGSLIERIQERLERLVAAAPTTATEGRGLPAPSIRALDAAEGEGLAAVPMVSRQRSYADQWRRDLEFQVGEHVLLKVSPSRGIKQFGLRNKLSPRFVGPFEILERVGPVAYILALPPSRTCVHNVFHVSKLRKYIPDLSHVISPTSIQLREDLSYEEALLRILAREVKQLQNKSFSYVTVQWENHEESEATCELVYSMRERYPQLFAGMFDLSFGDETSCKGRMM
uniref:Tf2-1-like SH3-like domain-containing protein n=1 Tax=Ananas comosus var. bracteatus TaxID=296719 RepID=A0A6V7P9Z0_ANACO|nr:unnamed protein product [Ananas comosus var. bracteatus]